MMALRQWLTVTARSVGSPRLFSATSRQRQVLSYCMFLLLKLKDLFYTTELCITVIAPTLQVIQFPLKTHHSSYSFS